MKAVVSEKGQVTIPKSIRETLGLRPGTILEMAAVDGKLVGVKKAPTDPFTRWRGTAALPGALSVDDYLRAVRG